MSAFLYEQTGAMARITLNRPDVLNALTFDTYTELRDTFAGMNQRAKSPSRYVVRVPPRLQRSVLASWRLSVLAS